MKDVIIWLIHFYQRNASQNIRRCCRFEPTCSEYMIQAIEKHGASKGVLMGLGRLHRCKPPNGGIDKP